jgi:aspartyl-tRNA(Asn)/glutamyl-tRNA(Gln) amidotransferase subunit A
MNFTTTSVTDLLGRYRKRETTVTEVTSAVLDRIEKEDTEIQAFVTVTRSHAMEAARGADEALAAGQPAGPLFGVPVAVKDNLHVEGIPTTCSSKILAAYVPPFTATAVERMRAAGAIIVGKTNMDEFAMGSSTENSAFFPTRNPHDASRVTGGSSGGSAAAVAAGFVPLALGSDTGGSIRQPAAFCGVVGLKPTYGRVSRYGLVAFASSLDQVGPLAGTVGGAARLFRAISGFDAYDATSQDVPLDPPATGDSIQGLRIGVPREYFVDGMDSGVSARVRAAIGGLESLGCRVEEISLPHTEYAVAAYYLIATAEASSNLARFDGVRYGLRAESSSLDEMYRRTRMAGFGPEVRRRILLGTYALSAGYYDAYYLKAQKVRTLILEDFEKAFRQVDLIATPTTPTTAFRIGEKTRDPLDMYLNDIFTLPTSLAGLPGISIPCGTSEDGMPVGLQLIGNHFQEGTLLEAALAFENSGTFAPDTET